MQDVSFSLHLPEQVHDRLVKVKQLRAPDASWTDFFELVCTELEGNPAQSKRRPWRMGAVKDDPLFAKAIEMVKELEEGQEFTLWHFFGDQWDKLPEPRVFGRLFKQEVEKQKLAMHIDDDKSLGVAVYRRLGNMKALFT